MPEPYYKNESVTLYCGDCLDVLPELSDTFNLLLTDPPYSRVKDDDWDRCSHAGLLELLDGVFRGVTPMMKFNAALYCFCWPNFSDRLSMLIREHFALLGSIVWCKRRPDGKLNGMACKAGLDSLRVPFTETERILFGCKKECVENTCDTKIYLTQRRMEIMSPIYEIFKNALLESKKTLQDLTREMSKIHGGYTFCRHSFSLSDFRFPPKNQYEIASRFLKLPNYFELKEKYEKLKELENLDKRYYLPKRHNFTDLWFYQPVGHGSRDRIHNCQKPLPMLLDMIETSCRPGGLVLDPFAGSGTTGVAAMRTGRRAVLIERDERNCEIVAKRFQQERDLLFQVK